MNSRPKILFAISHVGFFRNFERTIKHLTNLGYDVTVVFSKNHKSITVDDFSALKKKQVKSIKTKFLTSKGMNFIYKQRVYRDVLFYARKEFRDAIGLRSRFVSHQKGYISTLQYQSWLRFFEIIPGAVRNLIDTLFGFTEKLIKPHQSAINLIDETNPDMIIVSPLVHFFTHEVEFVKEAKRRGIPTVLAVASWDNLTNKGIVKVKPDLVAVWNEAMAEEAVNLHSIPRTNVVLTGATVFDWWYDKSELWDKERFVLEAKLRPVEEASAPATLLYLCSSASIASGSEVNLVENWIDAVRNASDPRIRNARIIVRLHPMAQKPWEEAISNQQKIASVEREYSIYPVDVSHPTNKEQKAIFLNSIYHADAIVGLNTSAMIEAAIMGKPVLTFKGHGAEDSQMKNLHFQHLVKSGSVRLSEDLSTHVEELGRVLDDTENVKIACESFVAQFVRPRGLEHEAADLLANEIDKFYKSQLST